MSEHRGNAAAEIHDILARRWSLRAFDANKPVEKNKLIGLLEAARWAPSCSGNEPWPSAIRRKPACWMRAFRPSS